MYVTCPYKYYRQRVLKDVKDTLSEKAEWGIKVHKSFENAVNYGDPLPEGCQQWQSLAENIKALPGIKHPEFRFSIDDAFQQCLWRDAWSRGQADLVIRNGSTAVILDYKTGKRKPSDQLALYAGYAFAYWPELQRVHTAFVWLQEKKFDKKSYERKDVPEIWKAWIPIVRRLENSYDKDEWEAKPCGLCRGWCPVKDCRYHSSKS